MYKSRFEARKRYHASKWERKLEASRIRNEVKINKGKIKRALQMGEE